MKLIDTSHNFFRPLWVRLVIVGFAFAWAGFELTLGETLWALAFTCLALYCAWVLLWRYPQSAQKDENNG